MGRNAIATERNRRVG